MKYDFEKNLEAKHARRMKADDRAYDKLNKKYDAAEAMIGTLNSGKLYIYPVGGKYREGTKIELIDFLIRNKYV